MTQSHLTLLLRLIHSVDLPCVFRGLGRVKKEDVNDPVCQVKDDHRCCLGYGWYRSVWMVSFGVDGITDRLIMVSHDPLVKQGCCTAGDDIMTTREMLYVKVQVTQREMLYVKDPLTE